jgi:hypothetical protein
MPNFAPIGQRVFCARCRVEASSGEHGKPVLRRVAGEGPGRPSRDPPAVVPAHAGYPVRRALSIPSLPPLEYWVARSSRAMTAVGVVADTASRSRGWSCPSFALKFPCPLQSEGAGNAGRPMRPIAACAEIVELRTRVSQVTPESPGIPHAMVLRIIRDLPGDRAFLPPSPLRTASQELDASVGASGPRDFSVRVRRRRLQHHPRPPHPAASVRDVAQRPSKWGGTGSVYC